MPRMIDQIRASKLPSNMMQFAARGALQVPAAENIEILVHLARHNKVFGDLARMTLAGWDEKASRAAAGDPQTPAEVLEYFISPDNLRPKLLPTLLENPSVTEGQIIKLALAASRETIDIMLKSPRVQSLPGALDALRSSPHLKPEEVQGITNLMEARKSPPAPASSAIDSSASTPPGASPADASSQPAASVPEQSERAPSPAVEEFVDEDGTVAAYLNDHMHDIESEGEKPFQAIGGIVDLLGADYFPVVDAQNIAEPAPEPEKSSTAAPDGNSPAAAKAPAFGKKPKVEGKRENTLQKINGLDVKGRIQLALKGNKEERSILIRDGTKVVCLAVLEAPKLSDGEVEKFASQKNVLEAVLRAIPLKRRFAKNYIVVRNLVANPRTPLDLGLGLMKNLLAQDLKNLSANKEVSETIRKLALKMYKQKVESANKK